MMTPASRLVLTAAARGALLDAAASPAAVRACPAALLPAPQPASWRSFAAAVPSPAAGAPLQEPAFTHAQMPPRAHEHPKFPNTAYSTATLGVPQSVAVPAPAALHPPDPGALRFDDPKLAFAAHSNLAILRSLAVFSACSIKPLVKNADSLLALAKRVMGTSVVNGIVRRTFFKHFCAGEDAETIRPTLSYLADNGIGGILDYAAESDVSAEDGAASRQQARDLIVARTFDYEGEAACDGHMRTFLKCIQAAAASDGQGFAAIKMTALGQPKLLERVSASLTAIRDLFAIFDADLNGIVTRGEFDRVYSDLFDDATPERMDTLFKYLDKNGTGRVDYLSWSRSVKLEAIPLVVQHCRTVGPLSLSALNAHELQLLQNMLGRLCKVAQAAAESGVRVMIDAEHSYFQPAIDHAAMEVQRRFNAREPVVYNTYQCYLKDSSSRLAMDMERAQREGWCFGAKLVRGAYMFMERDRAKQCGYPSPVHDSIEATHANYNECVDSLLERVAEGSAEVMVATHNQHSIEHTVARMAELGLEPPGEQGVFFGQLLGMADQLTFPLGRSGYRAYKYVPFGPVDEVMPYLIRRAQENSDLMGGVGHEMSMLRRELWRRMVSRNPVMRTAARAS